ncbi:hypothetical protein bgla_1g00530 [Burkholderia gladioli BSR3]|uniref:Uncharacterized protein n=1 Tax=Burkholderia gladioli (strain BSR3) TaxID=999541 RepID=F2LH30_BURGS|nr:hypothetical protein bgla_1g00530 [Burkholderia gladioli BSR3]NBI48040.1 hypothetical protein [Burkholderia sp. ISTR5]
MAGYPPESVDKRANCLRVVCASTVDVNGVTWPRRTAQQKLLCESLCARTACASAYDFPKPMNL